MMGGKHGYGSYNAPPGAPDSFIVYCTLSSAPPPSVHALVAVTPPPPFFIFLLLNFPLFIIEFCSLDFFCNFVLYKDE